MLVNSSAWVKSVSVSIKLQSETNSGQPLPEARILNFVRDPGSHAFDLQARIQEDHSEYQRRDLSFLFTLAFSRNGKLLIRQQNVLQQEGTRSMSFCLMTRRCKGKPMTQSWTWSTVDVCRRRWSGNRVILRPPTFGRETDCSLHIGFSGNTLLDRFLLIKWSEVNKCTYGSLLWLFR